MDEAKHQCTKCGEFHPFSKFQLRKGKPSGQCRACKSAGMKALRAARGIPVKNLSQIVDGKKLCTICKTFKLLSEFSPAKRGLGGVSTSCKPCFAAKYKPEAEDVVARTASYRQRHRERHLANHRVRMFKRRTLRDVTDDGTVTDGFLKFLYATATCHYCQKHTEREKRTADHCVPLARGGPHSASNMVMACWTCNSTKRDLTDQEFMEKIREPISQ
jgi:5-methylcytosine-specific restriction endonuclease McrA